jgi:hypothetical protein
VTHDGVGGVFLGDVAVVQDGLRHCWVLLFVDF